MQSEYEHSEPNGPALEFRGGPVRILGERGKLLCDLDPQNGLLEAIGRGWVPLTGWRICKAHAGRLDALQATFGGLA